MVKNDLQGRVIHGAYRPQCRLVIFQCRPSHRGLGAQGPLGDFSITNFSRNEPLEEGVTVSVTAKLAKFEEWVEVA